MNKGAEALNNVLNILETMTVEEYERLYDDVCEQYGDSEIVTILDKPTEIKSIYSAYEKISCNVYISEKNINGYNMKTSKTPDIHQDDVGLLAEYFSNPYQLRGLFGSQKRMVSYVN